VVARGCTQVMCGCTWLCAVAPGFAWLHLVLCGCTLVMCGCTWLYLVVWLHVVMCGCTWLCVVAPSLTLLNHCIPVATVLTTRCSYTYQHKRELYTKAARKVRYVVPIGILVCCVHVVTCRLYGTQHLLRWW
jgi:hypothetical protein